MRVDSSASIKINDMATIRGRAGFAVDHWLFYGRGGRAWAREYYAMTLTATSTVVGSANDTRTGWTAGAGVEYALNKWMSVFAEYNYYDFGNRTLTFVAPSGAFFRWRMMRRFTAKPSAPRSIPDAC